MSHKHVINEPRQLVNDALKGLGRLNDKVEIRNDGEERVIVRREVRPDRVALISGGGSGHEPAHAGFVGDGLLTAAVCGNVFASPNVGQIRLAVEACSNEKGTIAIIMRYTGDYLLFGLAKEQYQASSPPDAPPYLLTVVGDDCAVPRSQGKLVGRRGLAGTILVYKLAGALADEGKDVREVWELSEWAKDRVGTVGAGLSHCHIPGTSASKSHLAEDEVEIGMGIHNEAGVSKMKLPKSKDLVAHMLKLIIDTEDQDRAFVPFRHDGKDEVIMMVNNLGGMSELEMSSIANDAIEHLATLPSPIHVRRVMCGSFMTSLNLPGFSLTLLLLPREGEAYSRDRVLELFDSPASAPGWKLPAVVGEASSASKGGRSMQAAVGSRQTTGQRIECLESACKNVIAAEPEITRYDTIAGDGDCGLTLKSGAEGVLELIQSGKIDSSSVVDSVLAIAGVVEKRMDGTSGALYSIWMNALAAGIRKHSEDQKSSIADIKVWAAALQHALDVLYGYTPARKPSRTLVDPLEEFTRSFAGSQGSNFDEAVKAAVQAAEDTKDLVAKAGRAAYVSREELQKAQVPDPGAWGVAKLLEGFRNGLGSS